MARTAARDDAAEELVRELIRDFLPCLRVDQLFDGCIEPFEGLLRWWSAGLGDASAAKTPHAVWHDVVARFPRSGAFPLGPASERAARRLAAALLRDKAKQLRPPDLLQRFIALMLFETSMMNLRGSAGQFEDDFGFWYHWNGDGSFRTFKEEADLRGRVWNVCDRKSTELLQAWGGNGPDGLCPTDDDVDGAFREVFDTGPASRQTRWPLTALGVSRDHPAAQKHGVARGAASIVLRDPGATVYVDDEALRAACGGTLDSRVQDLIDIAATVYFADIYVPRDALFARELDLILPVRNEALWRKHAAALARIATFLTGNATELHVVAQSGSNGPRRKFKLADDERCVVLFSGGLDSFTGAALAIEEGREPILVSHSATPLVQSFQTRLLEHLRGGGRSVESITVRTGMQSELSVMQKPVKPAQELYQHGRSLLFLSLATAVALSRGIRRVRLYENGPVALNIGFSEARFNTRTTHPVFLALFRDLVRDVFGVEIEIENPFELLTKGEVVARLPEAHHPAIAKTNSCWAVSKVRVVAKNAGVDDFEGWHCGRCIPCVWRRAAVIRAGLERFDDEYLWDRVDDTKWERMLDRKHFTVLLDLYRACRHATAARSDDELLDFAPDLDEIGPGTLKERLEMHRRYAREIVGWFEKAAPRMRYDFTADRAEVPIEDEVS